MLATQSVAAPREPRVDRRAEHDAIPVADEVDEFVPLAVARMPVDRPNLYRPAHLDESAHTVSLPLDRKTLLWIAGFVALAMLAVGAGFTFRWLGSRGHATTPPTTASQSDAEAPVTQVRCEALDKLGYFIGSLTNRAKTPLQFRVDVTFTGRDGQPIGQGTQQTDFVVPGSTTQLDISAGLTGDVVACRATATRLSRDG